MFLDRRGSNMAEAAITMPVVLLVLMFTLNLSIAGAASVAASNAANYGARIGAVAIINDQYYAMNAAQFAMNNSGLRIDYSVYAEVTPYHNGGYSYVAVSWKVQSYLAGLCNLFGGGCPKYFTGTSIATYKKEGW
jgi:Flp pilus assembly protein TadG